MRAKTSVMGRSTDFRCAGIGKWASLHASDVRLPLGRPAQRLGIEAVAVDDLDAAEEPGLKQRADVREPLGRFAHEPGMVPEDERALRLRARQRLGEIRRVQGVDVGRETAR